MSRPDPVPHNDERAEELFLSLLGTVFEIDAEGRVWRIGVQRQGVVESCEPRRAEYRATNGYLRVRFRCYGIRVRVSAHRVVARYFFGEIARHHVVDHKDGERDNNHPHNLETVTQKVNVIRGVRRKRLAQPAVAS